MMLKRLINLIAIVLLNTVLLNAQLGINDHWISGYDSEWGLPFGINRMNFMTGSPIIGYDSLEMEFRHTHANISDSSGNLLFYTNGVYIADATNDTMMNGSGINPGAYSNFVPDGHLIPQGALILPKPDDQNLYYLFHCSVDNYPNPSGSVSFKLLKTVIDMSLNGGLGAVISKNQIIINDSLNVGKITSCKHGNGRDWWVVVHRVNSNSFYKLLVTPNGISGPYSQNIGMVRPMDEGQAKFSPNGARYAYYHYNSGGLDILEFDRCTGMFSNAVSDTAIPTVYGNVGLEFSPGSNCLYVSTITKVYQYDLTATNILATRTIVAVWDTFYDPFPPVGTYLCYPQLAPDGKIYITTGNGTRYMHKIENPDVVGVGCNVNQHSVQLPAYYFNTVPNHPSYFLGCDTTSCQCLTTDIPELPDMIQLKTYPNPTSGPFTLQFPVQNIAGEVAVYDVNGQLVHKENIAPWSQFKKLDLTNLVKGIYFCNLLWSDKQGTTKIILE